MKIYKSNYRNHWLSPYTILEKIYFWREIDYDEPIIEKLSDILNPFCVAWQKFLDIVHPKINYVKIDKYDTWSMDHTLADIILPMLKQLNEEKHGAPWVDDEDVPDELKSTSAPPKKNEWDTDDNHFKRWDWILDEMIYAFECEVDDEWEDQFHSGKSDLRWIKEEDSKFFRMEKGPNDTFVFDKKAHDKAWKRRNNALMLFGKYYHSLWD